MWFGPIFTIEMITGARRARYFLIRVLYATALFVALWLVYHEYLATTSLRSIEDDAARASHFFTAFSFIQLAAVLMVGPAVTAGAIAQERERRTLEYLLASSLGAWEIVLSKLLARLAYIFSALLVGLPVLALVGLMGGVRPEAIVLSFLIAASTAVAISSLSISASVWSRRPREAMQRVYLILFALLFLPYFVTYAPWIGGFGGWLQPTAAARSMLGSNPIHVLIEVIWSESMSLAESWDAIAPMLAVHAVASVFCIVLAGVSLRWVHLRAAGRTERPGRMRRLQWRPRLGGSPMLWKELFAERRSVRLGALAAVAGWILVLAMIGSTVWAVISTWPAADSYLNYAASMGTFVATLGLLMITSRAATTVTSEKERDCWDSLLVTPLTGGEIMWAKLLGNLYWARWLLIVLAVIWAPALAFDPAFLGLIPFLGGTLFLLSVYASSLGLAFSLWCRSSVRAMGGAMATALFLGGGYLFCCLPFLVAGGGPGSQVVLAGLVPMLLASPPLFWQEFMDSKVNYFADEMLPPYLVGMGLYAFVTIVLLLFCHEALTERDQRVRREGGGAANRPQRVEHEAATDAAVESGGAT